MINNLSVTNQRMLKISMMALLVISLVFSSAFAFSANSYGATKTEQQKEANMVSTKAAGDGVVTGVVKSKTTGSIITDAGVYLNKYSDENLDSVDSSEFTTVNSSGVYQFTDVEDGVYYVEVYANDYCYFDSTNITISQGNTVTCDASLFPYDECSSISGIVYNLEGKPLSNATIIAFLFSERTGEFEMRKIANTDDEGKYTISDLQPGKHTLEFYHNSEKYDSHFWGYEDSLRKATSFMVGEKQMLSGFDTSLKPVDHVRVKFNSSGGSDVPIKYVKEDEALGKLPITAKKGHVFTGWYLSTLKVTNTFVPSHNITLVAKWRAESKNNNLKGISKSTGKLSPKFKSSKTTYKLSLSSSKKSVKVTPKLSDSYSKMQIKVGSGKYKTVKAVKVNVNKGKTKKVQIKVTAENGKAKVYTVKVKRAK